MTGLAELRYFKFKPRLKMQWCWLQILVSHKFLWSQLGLNCRTTSYNPLGHKVRLIRNYCYEKCNFLSLVISFARNISLLTYPNSLPYDMSSWSGLIYLNFEQLWNCDDIVLLLAFIVLLGSLETVIHKNLEHDNIALINV